MSNKRATEVLSKLEINKKLHEEQQIFNGSWNC